MSKNILLNFFLIFLLIGIFIENSLLNIKLSLLILLFLIILFINFYIYVKKYKNVLLFISLGFLSGILISFFYINNVVSKYNALNFYLNSNKNNITFKVINLYKVNNDYNIYNSKLISINDERFKSNIDLLVYIPLNYQLKSGDILSEKVKIYSLKNLDNFKYKYFMISKNIYFKIYINSINIIGYNKPNYILYYIYKVRNKLLNILHILYPKDEGDFLGGILFGARQGLSNDLQQDFNNSGLTHLIAVSGFNITILIIFFGFFLSYFPSWLKIVMITIFIIIFVILVGFGISVIRAAIMGLLAYYILLSGRDIKALTIILITASLIVIFSPFSLNYDISLHLSFLAVLGIIYTQGFFNKIFNFIPNILALKEAFVLTLSALSFSFPIILFNFGHLSILTIFANLSVVWNIPIAMFLGFLSIIVYLVYNPIGWIISYITWIFLKWDIIMVNFFGNQKWAILSFINGKYSSYLEIFYNILLLFLILYFYDEKKENKLLDL